MQHRFKHIMLLFGLLLSSWAVLTPWPLFAQAAPPALPATWKARWWEQEVTPLAPVPVALPLPAQSAATDEAADWWLLVHQSLRDGNWEIYRGTVNNYTPVRLTYQAASDLSPRLNAIGTRIVFVSNRDGNYEIYAMNADGSGQVRLTNSADEERSPVWSPDGSQILYTLYRKGNPDLYVMNADGSGQHRLTGGADIDFQPSWSPDGASIVFVRAVDEREGRLWRMQADGSGAYPLTGNLRYVAHPVWSPDGTQIAFDYDGTKDYLNEVAVINADGSGLQMLQASISDSPYYREYQLNGWGPDGKRLLYSDLSYELVSNQLLVRAITLAFLCLNINDPLFITYCSTLNTASTADYAADVRLLDKWPPVTRLQPLPLYSRKPYVTVNWRSTDIGPAGVGGYETFSRTDLATEWMRWGENLKTPSATFYTMDNGKIYFQARAYDQADNWEGLPTTLDGSVSTTLFSWLLNGQLTDARGIPQSRQALTLQPAPVTGAATDLFGNFSMRLADSDSYLLNSRHRLNVTFDRQRQLYQHPATNLLQNGDFEAGLHGWQTSPKWVALSSGEWAVAGDNALHLGQPCYGLCLVPALQEQVMFVHSAIVADHADHLHVMGRLSTGGLYYRHRAPNQPWDQDLRLTNDSNVDDLWAVVDRADTLWVVWSVFDAAASNMPMLSDRLFYYSKRLSSGEWSAPAYITKGSGARIAADNQGGLHLLYSCSKATCGKDLLQYRYLAPNGSWSADTTLTLYPHFPGMDDLPYALAVTPDGVAHVLYRYFVSSDQLSPLQYQTRLPTGQWPERRNMADLLGIDMQSASDLQLVADSQGNLHLYWFSNSSYYAYQALGDRWSSPEVILARNNMDRPYVQLIVDHQDRLHLLAGYSNSQGIYRTKALNQPWSVPQVAPLSFNYARPSIAAGAANALYFTAANMSQPARIEEIQHMTNNVASAISQTLTLPADLSQPTLAFLYTIQGGGPTAHLAITVTEGITATAIFSAATTPVWRLGWADLTPWQGKTITLTLAAVQLVGEVDMQLYLDDLWVGSWQTPVAQSVSPPQVDSGLAATLTITGENFLAGTVLKLGENVLSTVQRLDEHTLQANLPPTLPPGIYDLWVTNPGGETSVRAGALQVGKQFFLPLAAR